MNSWKGVTGRYASRHSRLVSVFSTDLAISFEFA